jgi:hypothetical protein
MSEDIYHGNFRKYLQLLAPGTIFVLAWKMFCMLIPEG